jgi:hypothetical protein
MSLLDTASRNGHHPTGARRTRRGSIVFGFSLFTTPSPRMFQLGYGEGLKEESARKTPAKIKEERDRYIIVLKTEKDNLL